MTWFPFLWETVYKESFMAQRRELVLTLVMGSLWCLIPIGNNGLRDPSMCTEHCAGAKWQNLLEVVLGSCQRVSSKLGTAPFLAIPCF